MNCIEIVTGKPSDWNSSEATIQAKRMQVATQWFNAFRASTTNPDDELWAQAWSYACNVIDTLRKF